MPAIVAAKLGIEPDRVDDVIERLSGLRELSRPGSAGLSEDAAGVVSSAQSRPEGRRKLSRSKLRLFGSVRSVESVHSSDSRDESSSDDETRYARRFSVRSLDSDAHAGDEKSLLPHSVQHIELSERLSDAYRRFSVPKPSAVDTPPTVEVPSNSARARSRPRASVSFAQPISEDPELLSYERHRPPTQREHNGAVDPRELHTRNSALLRDRLPPLPFRPDVSAGAILSRASSHILSAERLLERNMASSRVFSAGSSATTGVNDSDGGEQSVSILARRPSGW